MLRSNCAIRASPIACIARILGAPVTDPHGNGASIASITQKFWPLGGDTVFVPGHGPLSNFGHERQTNPFVADAVLARG